MRDGRPAIRTLVVAAFLCPAITTAQTLQKSQAVELLEEGRRFLRQRDLTSGCPMITKSFSLDANTGALLLMAACHEQEGKLATASKEYAEVAGRAEDPPERRRAAQAKVAALRPKLSTLTISVSADAISPELRIRVDGVELPGTDWGLKRPVDPGNHLIEADDASGKKVWKATVEVDGHADRKVVVIPFLESSSEVTPISGTEPANPAKRALLKSVFGPPANSLVDLSSQPDRSIKWYRRPWVLALGGVAIAGVVVSGFMLLRKTDKCPAFVDCR